MSALLTAVEAWCQDQFTPPPAAPAPLQLLNVRPTADELATWPMPLSIQAYFAGARYAAGEPLQWFPRPLTAVEAESWADGAAEHRAELAADHLELDAVDPAVICA